MSNQFTGAGAAAHPLINPRKLTPTACLLFMMAIWALVYAVAPVTPYAVESLYPYVLLGLGLAGLLIGFSLFEPRSTPAPVTDRDDLWRSLRALYRATYFLGLTGIAFRAVDWVVYRGFSIAMDFAENRERAEEAGGNPFSSIAVFLIPFTVAPYIFHAVARRNGLRVGRAWTAAGLAILWPCMAMLVGSRSTIFMQVGMLAIARILIIPRFPWRAILTALTLFLVLAHIAGYIFILRTQEFGLSIDGVSRLSAFTHLIPATDEYFYMMDNLESPWREILFIDVTMCQYFLHGVPEFSYLVEHYVHGDNWGAYTFTALVRIYSTLAGIGFDGEAMGTITPRFGIYTTLLGPLYVDFGPLIPIVAIIIGGFVSWVRRRVLEGSIGALPLSIVLTMQVIAAVVVNTITSAYGLFYDLAFIGLWIGFVVFRRGARRHAMLNAEASA